MAIIKVMPGEAIISGFRGVLDYYYYCGLAVVRKWPASPGHKRSPEVEAGWSAFTAASRLWTQLSPEVQRS